jgi:hypothetical protein
MGEKLIRIIWEEDLFGWNRLKKVSTLHYGFLERQGNGNIMNQN